MRRKLFNQSSIQFKMKKGNIYASLERKRRIIIFFSFVAVLILWIFKTENSLIRIAGALTFLISFYLVDHLTKVDFKERHYLFIILIAFINFPLGELYLIYPSFDKFAHYFLPIMLSSIVLYMVSRLKIELKWKIVFTFFIIVGILGVLEIGEYALDNYFDFRLQGIYLYHTPTDF